ncbi:CHAT domain-containing protein [Actinokineospora auranticolor]|uniref:CHAT domain-containing protein n=1 Tax=Actinokineospora auranticolor TaxID=155976 RepID=A0A2S6GCF2_9PSEU|nr:CHAT domain-containing protein [Actinokineospora auranticolor]PPK62398.1 CHAT domain-containing protein [Actinokineospora auranticolor]
MLAVRRAGALYRRGRKAVYAYTFARARALLGEAVAVLDSAPEQNAPEVVELRVRVLVTLAYAETEGSSITTGIKRLSEADELLDELPVGPRRTELAGLSVEQRGFLHIRAGNTELGLELLDEAARRLRAGLAEGAGDPYVLASLYLNRSLAQIERSQTNAAIAELDTCIELCEKYELHDIAIKARHNRGYVAHMTGDVPTALRYFAETSRDCQERAPSMLPVVQLDQARALLAGGLVDEAARHLDDALPRLRRQRVGQDAAEAEIARAAAALLHGDAAQARRRARRSERMFTRRGNERWASVAALAALRADTLTALDGDRARPVKIQTKQRNGIHVPRALPATAVRLAEQLRGLLLEDEAALALMLAVRLQIHRGDLAAATELLDQVPKPRVTTPVDHRMLLRLCRAELAVATQDTRGALAEARAGLTELGRARDRMGGLELMCGTAVHGRQLGDMAVRLVLEHQRPDARRLFGWLERTRAQVYRYEPMPDIADPRMAEKATELRLAKRTAQLVRLAGRSAEKLEQQTATLEREVARQGWYASPWGKPRPVATLEAVGPALDGRVLVSFATSDDDLVAVVVAGTGAKMVRLGSAVEAAEWAARLHADLDVLAPDTLPPPIVEVVKTSAARSAGGLDRQLIQPLLPLIGDRDLVIVPTGALYAVPWGSLPSLWGRPIVVAPSATAWLSAATGSAPRGRTVLARGPMLTGLVAEEGPLREIYPEAVALDGDHATVAGVLSALDGAELAHLAAHGEHEPTNALFSRLELADGPLFAYELSRLRQPPRQVVLAACELALNYVRPGDEALGYAGALLASGVRTVIAATSRVGDESAATAMVTYHRSLTAGVAPARALAASIAEDPYRRPFICLGAG